MMANDDAWREWSREQQLAAHEVMGSSQGVHLVSPVMRAPLTAVVTIVALTVSCTGTSTDGVFPSSPSAGAVPPGSEGSPSAQPVTDYDSFPQGLAAAGFSVREGDRTVGKLFLVPGQTVLIDDVHLSTYEYPTEATLDEERAAISRDGHSVPTKTGGRDGRMGALTALLFGRQAPRPICG
jgi:hypothetical protein